MSYEADHSGTAADNQVVAGTGTAPIVFFDGVCGLCNRSVDFILVRDSAGVFRFAPLQGTTAAARLPMDVAWRLDSLVLVDERGVHQRSTAVVRILWRLGGVWRVPAALLWLVPRPVRNWAYTLVARWRYRLFGKHDTCRMPTPDERSRFLP